jgi:hypothetical protein
MTPTRRSTSKLTRQSLLTGATPAFVGASFIALLVVLRAVASATPERALIFGRPLLWGCLFQRAFGVPCPACGLTRGVLLTLQGQLADALRLNPAAPLIVAGVVASAAALVLVAVYQRARDPLSVGRVHARLRIAARAYAGLVFAVLFVHWIAELLPVVLRAI